MNSVIIGQRIKDARKSMNLTQKELGYLIYADGKYISRLENGGSLPSLKRLVLLSRVLNRTCDYFIWDIDVMEEDVTPREEIVIRDEQEREASAALEGDMLKIAVYSEEKVMSPLLQEYMGIWQRDTGCVCTVRYYDNVHAIMVDMDLEGIYDVVVVYRSWDVADVLKNDHRVGSLVMIAAGINRRLYDIQPCYILYEPVNAANFKKVMAMAVEGSRDERRFTFVSGRVRYSVDTRSIMYFESELRRINLVTTEQKYVFYGSIGEVEKRMKVGCGGFIRPHESYLVNSDHVSKCTAHEMILTNGKSIHISATRRADVKRYYSELINC